MQKLFFRHRYIVVTLLYIVLCSMTLNNSPYGDDWEFVFVNHIADGESFLSFWNPLHENFKSWPIPFSIFHFFLNIFGQEVIPFRLLNLLIHILNSFLFLNFARKLKTDSTQREQFLLFSLFLIHPISMMTFNWVFQLKTLLATSFSLLTLIYFERIKCRPLKSTILAIIFFILALNSKITCVLLPFYLLLKRKSFPNLKSFVFSVFIFFLITFYYGLINLKGMNSFLNEKLRATEEITEYSKPVGKIVETATTKKKQPELLNYVDVELQDQLKDSFISLTSQMTNLQSLQQKIILPYFTFGRYIVSTFGLQPYSLVYEQNLESLEPAILITFALVSFIFLFNFVDRKRIKEIILLIIFFLPISGIIYITYMKYSFTANHWFYPALPFTILLLIINRPKSFQYTLSAIIRIQFLASLSLLRSSENAIEVSHDRYNHPLMYAYTFDGARHNHEYLMAYQAAKDSVGARNANDPNMTKYKLKTSISRWEELNLSEDLKEFLNYAILSGQYNVASNFISEYHEELTSAEMTSYMAIIQMCNKHLEKKTYLQATELLRDE